MESVHAIRVVTQGGLEPLPSSTVTIPRQPGFGASGVVGPVVGLEPDQARLPIAEDAQGFKRCRIGVIPTEKSTELHPFAGTARCAVRLVPIAMETRRIGPVGPTPSTTKIERMGQYGLALVRLHPVPTTPDIPSEGIRFKVRFGQSGVRLMAQFIHRAQLELDALGRGPFDGPPPHLSEHIEFGESGRTAVVE